MPPRIPLRAAPLRCSNPSPMASMVHRFAAASISTSARLSFPPRSISSSGASFLDMDGESSSSSSSFSEPSNSEFARPRSKQSTRDANAALSRVLFDSETRRHMHERSEERKRSALERLAERKVSDDYQRQMPRRWRVGELYAPHDLSSGEMRKWRHWQQATTDAVDVLGINPLDEYRNFAMISEFITPTGKIRHTRETGLRPVNQRRMARAIRRAIGLGLHPSVYRHPEILMTEMSNMPKQNFATTDSNNRNRR